jgi:polyketide biosynthesis enoyl-CoA hydratase PksH
MTLTTQTIDVREAHRIGLVDQIADDPDDAVRRLLLRVGRVKEETIGTAKDYFSRLWPLTDQIEADAVQLSASLICDPANLEGIRAFVQRGGLPWQKSS